MAWMFLWWWFAFILQYCFCLTRLRWIFWFRGRFNWNTDWCVDAAMGRLAMGRICKSRSSSCCRKYKIINKGMWQKVMLFKNESKSHAPQEWGRGVMLPREQNHAPPRMGAGIMVSKSGGWQKSWILTHGESLLNFRLWTAQKKPNPNRGAIVESSSAR